MTTSRAVRIKPIKLQCLMVEKSFTQGDLANEAGLSRATVNVAIKTGSCRASTAIKMANALGVAVAEIIETEE